jgi:hypothetical protein
LKADLEPHMTHTSNDHKADARAAFVGLILGAIVLFGIVRGIVYLTNQSYAGHAEATKTP